LARKAISPIAQYYNITVEEAAHAIIRIANFQAAQAIRLISVQRGYDPREFALIAHGGSGPMLAPFIAEDLNIPRIIVPSVPAGVFNAWGMLVADLRHDIVYTEVVRLEASDRVASKIDSVYRMLEDAIRGQFEKEGLDPNAVILQRQADARYYGQEHTIKIPIPGGMIGPSSIKEIINVFHEHHMREYGFVLEDNLVEIVNFHVVGIVRTRKPPLPEASGSPKLSDALIEERSVYYGPDRGFVETPVYDKAKLPVNVDIEGPAIIEEKTSTIIVPQGFTARKDRYGNVIVSR
nr:hypothetical protein [Desulfurococcales archaeon]